MDDKKQCPLCGKLLNDDDRLCEECQNHVDNQYTADFLNREDQVEEIHSDDQEYLDHSDEESESSQTVISEVVDAPVEYTPKRKGLSKGVIFVLVGCILLVIVGVISSIKVIENRESEENEDMYWSQCVEENTPVSYSKYLVTFQDGRYVDEANMRIREFREAENQAWEKLKASSDINDFYAYLGESPKTPHINQIKFLMDSLSWLAATDENTADAYQAYLENVKLGNLSGNYVDTAENKYSYLSQIKVLEGTSLDSIKTEMNHIFATLSENNPKYLLKIFAPEVFYYSEDSVKSSTNVVSAINDKFNGQKIESIKYIPNEESVIAKMDNKGIIFIDLIVNSEIIYETKIKVGKKTENKKVLSTDTFKIELNGLRQIQSISSK